MSPPAAEVIALITAQLHAPTLSSRSTDPERAAPVTVRERQCDPGTVVAGRYVLLDRLGAGATATVYCAADLLLQRKVALKLLRGCFADDEELVERFHREALIAAALRHRHVIAVFDRGEWNGTQYMTMEYVPGRSLESIIRHEAPLTAEWAIDLALQLLQATRFVHRSDVLHRDLKPENAIVDRHGQLKLTDFGIARIGVSRLTQTGSIIGTALYASPEQLEGHAVVAASDLYSVGIILYELLTGRVPFEGESVLTVALKQVNERPAPPTTINAAVPAALERIVLRALKKDPARRYRDADTFIAALEQAKLGLSARAARCGTRAAKGATGSAHHGPPAETQRWRRLRPPWPAALRREKGRTRHEAAPAMYKRLWAVWPCH